MRNKISTKVIASILLCSVIISAVVGITSIYVATKEIKHEAFGEVASIAESKANKYSIEIQNTENTVKEYTQIIVDNIDESKLNDASYMNEFEKEYGSMTKSIGISNSGIIGLYINFNPDLTGKGGPYDLAYYYSKNTNQADIFYNSYTKADYNEGNSDLKWYYDSVKGKEGIWSKPYVDSKSEDTSIISYTMPVYKNDKLIGVAGIDIAFSDLKSMLLDTKVYDTGNVFLLDKDFEFLVEKGEGDFGNLNTIGNGQFQYLVEEIKSKKQLVVEDEIGGKKIVLGYYTLSNGQVIGVRAYTDEVLQNINTVRNIMIMVMMIGLILAGILGRYVSKKISTPIEMATNSMKRLAELDLTESEENFDSLISNKDETGIMIESLLAQRYELIEIVKALRMNSHSIKEGTNIISEAEIETAHSIAMITNVMERLSERACEQVEKVSKGSMKLDNIANEIKESLENILKLEGNSKVMEYIQEKGSQSLKSLSEKFEENIKSINSSENNINELMGKIGLMEGFISEIHLASDVPNESNEKTREFTNKMKDTISEIKKGLEKTNVDNYKIVFEEVKNIMEVSTEAFEGIGKAANNTIREIEEFAVSLYKLNKNKDDVIVAIEEISQLTEEVTLSVENVTASIEEQESAMRNTSERTIELKNVSKTLDDIVQKFKI